jgi:aconitate hydratase
VAAVLSGNRNFEARIHQNIKSNFLASPMLVVIFALAGRVDIDLTLEPVGIDPNGQPVYLADLWPSHDQIDELVKAHVKKAFYEKEYARIFDGDRFWDALDIAESTTFAWNRHPPTSKTRPTSTGFPCGHSSPRISPMRVPFLLLGDTVTTDHISPAGAIPEDYPAGQYLIENGVAKDDFNSYGSRRGNHEVMMRGTFGNIRIKNQLVAPKQGSFTLKFPEGTEMFNYDAAMAYKAEGTPWSYWAARNTAPAPPATGPPRAPTCWASRPSSPSPTNASTATTWWAWGRLPLVFADGESAQSLGLDGSETFTISGVAGMTPRKQLAVKAVKADGSEIKFSVTSRLDTEVDVEYFENGGILPCVIRKMMAGGFDDQE